MNANIIKAVLFFLLTTFLVPKDVYSETTCDVGLCRVTLTIKIAFSGASDDLIEKWKQDIEQTWNQPDQTTGPCKCPLRVRVETMKITDPNQVNCTPPPHGFHCIMVTDYNTNPPKDTKGEIYMGYMYPPGVSRHGQSLRGWWSNLMNRPVEGGGGDIYHDAAHEAGHMMGLKDKEGGGIMTFTSGNKAKPTQANLDAAVNNVCGANACPKRCCCGNGKIDTDQGENCDINASPVGCNSPNQECCSVCCRCFIPICNPERKEYHTQPGCELNCTDWGSKCYKNLRTGCWECVKTTIVEHNPLYNQNKIVNCNHREDAYFTILSGLVGYDFHKIPMACDLFGTEWINLFINGAGAYSIITFDCVVVEVNPFVLEFPSVIVHTDIDTVDAISDGRITFEEALIGGKIIFEYID